MKYGAVRKLCQILAVRSIDGRKEYRVRWKGFGSKDYTWVQEDDCNSAMKNYARSSLKNLYSAFAICDAYQYLDLHINAMWF